MGQLEERSEHERTRPEQTEHEQTERARTERARADRGLRALAKAGAVRAMAASGEGQAGEERLSGRRPPASPPMIALTPSLFIGDHGHAWRSSLPLDPVRTPGHAAASIKGGRIALLPWLDWEARVRSTLELLGTNESWIERCLKMGQVHLATAPRTTLLRVSPGFEAGWSRGPVRGHLAGWSPPADQLRATDGPPADRAVSANTSRTSSP